MPCFVLSIILCSESQKGSFDTLYEFECMCVCGFDYRVGIKRKRFPDRPRSHPHYTKDRSEADLGKAAFNISYL
jgi:hypothetical protein